MGFLGFGRERLVEIVPVRDSNGDFMGQYYVVQHSHHPELVGQAIDVATLNKVTKYDENVSVSRSYYPILGQVVDDITFMKARRGL